ncbi:MAG: hypothetical protein DRO06_04745, partial [Thermoproteota archaeon]
MSGEGILHRERLFRVFYPDLTAAHDALLEVDAVIVSLSSPVGRRVRPGIVVVDEKPSMGGQLVSDGYKASMLHPSVEVELRVSGDPEELRRKFRDSLGGINPLQIPAVSVGRELR